MLEWPGMATQVEELADNKVRLKVDVPRADLRHAVEHATLRPRGVGQDSRLPPGQGADAGARGAPRPRADLREAVESHIGGWFWNAAATHAHPAGRRSPSTTTTCRPPTTTTWQFTATVAVQPKPEPRRLDEARGAVRRARGPAASSSTRSSRRCARRVAELAPVEGRPARTGDVLVIDALDERGRGAARPRRRARRRPAVEEIERALIGATPGETKAVEFELADGSSGKAAGRRSRRSRRRCCRRSTTTWRAPRASSTRSRSCAPTSSSGSASSSRTRPSRVPRRRRRRARRGLDVKVGGPLVEARAPSC